MGVLFGSRLPESLREPLAEQHPLSGEVGRLPRSVIFTISASCPGGAGRIYTVNILVDHGGFLRAPPPGLPLISSRPKP